ncbi:LacI family DNA-binding transcriptional regulator [Vallitalea sp.]|jgi:multiple sugar transport system substrate-binding protein|uniref:LacI family DNA-binding transcriptional regulator n=1 Tax=Vallitalea sp. TaxID=1882829 RepID=UPI0025D114EF|nr:LacI family DNA-binding transcriptional regulator [Vallitalea sp.]MCT4686693.1 LacI family DNA-binding transcriptional regulator [Vallitalea sp.]
MATMKDIAKLAGVSYGTVSNVLNKRGNVSIEKIRMVEDAAHELGYYINQKAQSLRADNSSEYAFIIPSINIYKYRKLYNLLRKKLAAQNITLQLHISDFNPTLEENFAYNASVTSDVVIVVTCMDEPELVYNNNIFHGVTLILVDHIFKNFEENQYSIIFDQLQIQKDMECFLQDKSYEHILFFSDNHMYSKVVEKMGENVSYELCQTSYDLTRAIEILSKQHYNLIITTSLEKYEAVVNAMNVLRISNDVEHISVISNKMTFDNQINYYYQSMNAYAEAIFYVIDNPPNTHIKVVKSAGFINMKSNSITSDAINILMVESPTTSAIKMVNSYLESDLGMKVNFDVIKYNQYDAILNENNLKKYDLIRIDMAYLPEISENIFQPISDIYDDLKENFVTDFDEYSRHNDICYALPLDIGCHIMMYRDDILNDQVIRRDYFEKTRKNVLLPKTFDDYSELEYFFDKYYNGQYIGASVCNGSNVTCGADFLIRVPHNDVLTSQKELNISDPDVLKALKGYIASSSYSQSEKNEFWDDVIEEYAYNDVAMTITFSNYIHLLNDLNRNKAYRTKFMTPPGGKSIIGGGVIGLSKYTDKKALCYRYLRKLYSDQMGKLITHLGGTMPIKSVYSDISLTTMYPWLTLLPEVIKNNTRRYYREDGKLRKSISFEKNVGKEVRKYIAYNLPLNNRINIGQLKLVKSCNV